MATVVFLGSTLNTTSGTHTVTATPAVGDLIVIVHGNTGNVTVSPPTDNNSSGTYTPLGSALKNTSADVLVASVRTVPIAAAVSTVFAQAGGTTTGGGLVVYAVRGLNLSGPNAIRQIATQANQAASGTPTPVFPAAVLTGNPVISAVFNGTSPGGVTARSSPAYTRDVNLGYSTPTTGLDTMSIASGETATSIAWGGTSASAFSAIAIEINATNSPIPLHSMIVKASTTVGSLSWTPTPGNLLLVAMTYNSQTAPSAPTDNQTGNTYAQANLVVDTSGGNTVALYSSVLVNSSGTFTITASLPVAGDFVIAEYPGYTGVGATASAANVGGTGTQPKVNLTTSGSASLIIGVEFDEDTKFQQLPIVSSILERSDTDNSSDERIAFFNQIGNAGTYAIGLQTGYSASWGVIAVEFTGGTPLTNTQSAVARIAVNKTLTQSAVARIQRNLTKTQSALGRIAVNLTKTQSTVARIANNSTKTQPAVSRIANIVTKTQTAKAAIVGIAAKTQSAVARIANSKTKTQPAIARIANNVTKTQPATARIQETVTKTQGAVARIADNLTKTQSAVARIGQTGTKTQPAVSRIANIVAKTQSAVARIQKTVTKTQPALSRIANNTAKTQPAVARISQTYTSTQSAKARIGVILTKTQSAAARIAAQVSKTQSATAYIKTTAIFTQSATARISNGLTKTQAAVARVANTLSSTQSAKARIANTPTLTQPAIARIAVVPTKTQSAVSRISVVLTKTQSATAAIIVGVHTKTQSATAFIINNHLRKYYTDSNGNIYWVVNQRLGLVEKV